VYDNAWSNEFSIDCGVTSPHVCNFEDKKLFEIASKYGYRVSRNGTKYDFKYRPSMPNGRLKLVENDLMSHKFHEDYMKYLEKE
jgi:hypothetical protein